MLRTTQISILLLAMAVFALPWSPALGDPLPGRDVLKFTQKPMIATPIGQPTPGTTDNIYYGHDELSTALAQPGIEGQYQGIAMADDFADEFSTPVVHVKWWGSYLNEQSPDGFKMARKFLISFESDVPAGILPDGTFNPFSHPRDPLLSQVVTLGPLAPMSGTFTEKLLRGADPRLGESLYEYNAELHCPFPQEPDTVYWLKIVALDDGLDPTNPVPLAWGWHNRDYTIFDPLASTPPGVSPGELKVGDLSADGTAPIYHFQDDAVSSNVLVWEPIPPNPDDPCNVYVEQDNYVPQHYWGGIDGPLEIEMYSKDLAFELYTVPVPEPSTLTLIGMGLFGLLGLAWRRHTR